MQHSTIIYNYALSEEQIALRFLQDDSQLSYKDAKKDGLPATISACARAYDGIYYGPATCSNNVTLIANIPPSISQVTLQSTDPSKNDTRNNLTRTIIDASNTNRTFTTWRVDGENMTLVYLPFENTMNEDEEFINEIKTTEIVSGNQVDVNEAVWLQTGGHDGNGTYYFNSSNDHIFVPQPLDPEEYSLEAWVKLENLPSTWMSIVYRTVPDRGSYYNRALEVHNDTTTNKTVFALSTYDATGPRVYGTTNLSTGVWYHVIATAEESGIIRLYVNGNLEKQQHETIAHAGGSTGWGVGYTQDGMCGAWGCSPSNLFVDDVRVWNRALSESQVRLISQNRDDTISGILYPNDVWQACVTPYDGSLYGNMTCSNNVTIASNEPPVITGVNLQSTDPTKNDTLNNLTRTILGSYDEENEPIFNITSWIVSGSPLQAVNLPFRSVVNHRQRHVEYANTTDYSGSDNNAVVSNAQWQDGIGPKPGYNSYNFNGYDSYISAGPGGAFDSLDEFSAEAWYQLSPNIDNPTHILLGTHTCGVGNGFYLMYNEPGLSITNGSLVFSVNSGATNYYVASNDNETGDGAWHHLVAVKKQSSMKLYLDGALDNERSDTVTMSGSGQSLLIGRLPNCGAGYATFNGNISNVRIWKKALGPQMVKALYQGRDELMTSEQLLPSERWQSCVTPNDGEGDGNMTCSNNVTMPLPEILSLSLNTTYNTNYTTENLTVHYTTKDTNMTAIDFRRDGTSVMLLNMPFQNSVTSTTTNAVADYSTYARNGTLYSDGGALPAYIDGINGKAFSFDGQNSIHVTLAGLSKPSAYTIEAWINAGAVQADKAGIVMSGDQVGDYDNSWGIAVDNDHLFSYNSYSPFGSTADPWDIELFSTTVATPGWHQIVVTDNGFERKYYRDGQFVNNLTNDPAVPNIGGVPALSIGSWGSEVYGANSYFDGSIDEVRIYGFALSADQVRFNYNSTKDRVTPRTLVTGIFNTGELWTARVTPSDGGFDGPSNTTNEVEFRDFIVTLEPPTDANNSIVDRRYLSINASCVMPDVENVSIIVMNSTGQVINTSVGPSALYVNVSVPDDGDYLFYASANDVWGNTGRTGTYIVNVDTTPPGIFFTPPTAANKSTFRSTIPVNVTMTEPHPKNITVFLFRYSMPGAPVQENTSETVPFFINYTDLPQDTYFFNATGFDTLNHSNSSATRLVYIVDVSPPDVFITDPSPADGASTPILKQLLTCNYSDENQLNNYSIIVRNESGDTIYDETTQGNGSIYNERTYTVYLPVERRDAWFNWTCYAYDTNDAYGAANESRILYYNLTNVSVDLIRPIEQETTGIDSNLTNDPLVNFKCNATHPAGIDTFKVVLTNGSGYMQETPQPADTGVYDEQEIDATLWNEGIFNWTCWANATDSMNNQADYSRQIELDITPPNVTFVPPTDAFDTIYDRHYIIANISVEDDHLRDGEVCIYDNLTLITCNSTWTQDSPTSGHASFNRFIVDGNYTVTGRGYDRAGNVGNASGKLMLHHGPYVNLMSPANMTEFNRFDNTTIHLTCNASSNLRLRNVTFFIWNETGDLEAQQTFNTTDKLFTPDLAYDTGRTGNWSWDCLASDSLGKSSWSVNGRRVFIENYTVPGSGAVGVSLISPPDESVVATLNPDLRCNASSTAGIFNVTVILFDNATGTEITRYPRQYPLHPTYIDNTTTVSLTEDQATLWNCLAFDGNNISGEYFENWTVTADITKPTVFFIDPTPDPYDILLSGSVTLAANMTDSHPENITLDHLQCGTMFGSPYCTGTGTDFRVPGPHVEEPLSLADGIYRTYAFGLDKAGNTNYSETRFFQIDTTPPTINGMSPDEFYSSLNVPFYCTVTDDTNIQNMSLLIYDETDALAWHDETEVGDSDTFYTTYTLSASHTLPYNVRYTWKCGVTDIGNHTIWSDLHNITADNIYPGIRFIDYTDPHMEVKLPGYHLFTANATMDDDNPKTLRIELRSRSGIHDFVESSSNQIDAHFIDPPEGKYWLQAFATDKALNTNSTETRVMYISDLTPPTVHLDWPYDDYVSPTLDLHTYCSATSPTDVTNLTFFFWDVNGTLLGSVPKPTEVMTPYSTSTSVLDVPAVRDLLMTNNDTNITWNCLGQDVANVTAWSVEGNRTFTIQRRNISFVYPTDTPGAVYHNRNFTFFNVSVFDNAFSRLYMYFTYDGFDYTARGNRVRYPIYYHPTEYAVPNAFENHTNLPDDMYYMRGCEADVHGGSQCTEERNVTIDAVPPRVTLLNPNAYQVIPRRWKFVCDINERSAWGGGNPVANLTLYIWNSTNGLVRKDQSITLGENRYVPPEIYLRSIVQDSYVFSYTFNSDGTFKYNCLGYNKLGSNSWSYEGNRTFYVDGNLPIVEFQPPTDDDGSIVHRTYIEINVSAESALQTNITAYLYNKTGSIVATINTTNSHNLRSQFTGLLPGRYSIRASAITEANTVGWTWDTRYIIVDDGIAPEITFIVPPTPPNGSVVFNDTVTIKAEANEEVTACNLTYYFNVSTSHALLIDGAVEPFEFNGYYDMIGSYNGKPLFGHYRYSEPKLLYNSYYFYPDTVLSWQMRWKQPLGKELFFRDSILGDPGYQGAYRTHLGSGDVAAHNTSSPITRVVPMTVDDMGFTASYTIPFLVAGTRYVYYVNCIDLGESIGQSETWNFITNNNTRPMITNITLLSLLGTNTTYEDLLGNATAVDDDGDIPTIIYDYKLDGVSLASLNLPFDTDNHDYSSNHIMVNIGNATAGAWPNVTDGKRGAARWFDGIDDLIVTTSPVDGAGDFTLSAWINTTQNVAPGGLTDGPAVFSVAGQFGLDVRGGNLFWHDEFGSSHTFDSSLPVADGVFHHIAVRRSGTTLDLFVDGVKASTTTGNNAVGSGQLVIGHSAFSSAAFAGTIDEVLAYKRPLSDNQISLMAASVPWTDIADQETEIGENWLLCATPSDGFWDGITRCSENITIVFSGAITPGISFSVENITNQSAIVNINTTPAANMTFNYGTTTALGTFINNATAAAVRSLLLDLLQNNTQYFFNITACAELCNSTTGSFTTLQNGDTGNLFIAPEDPGVNAAYRFVGVSDGQLYNLQRYNQTQTIFIEDNSTDELRVEFSGDFLHHPVNISKFRINITPSKTLVVFGETTGVDPSHTLYVPIGIGTGVIVCPDATTLDDINDRCSNYTLIPFADMHSGTVRDIAGATVTSSIINNSLYKLAGLHTTGVGEGAVTHLRIWDETETDGSPFSGIQYFPDDMVTFFANYTNSSGLPANTTDGACIIDFEPFGSPQPMTWNSTIQFFTYSRSFTSVGTFNWSVDCTDVNATDTVVISQDVPEYVPEFGTWALLLALGIVAAGVVNMRGKPKR